jgi:DNA-binding GntR family transcriptional regulator
MINKYSNIPLYSQLKNLIIEKIENGEYPPESKIPSEQELCELFDISRPTVRQAISELTNSGYIYKEKGKGTFVSKPKSVIDVKVYTGFSDSILDNENPGERNIVSIETITNKDYKKLSDIFSVSHIQTMEFAQIVYITNIDEEVYSYSTSYIPLFLFPNIIEDIMNKKQSFDILRGKYPLLPVKAKSSLEVVYTEPDEAQYLRVQSGQPLIKISNIIYSKSGQVVEYVVSKYRADKCMLSFENVK